VPQVRVSVLGQDRAHHRNGVHEARPVQGRQELTPTMIRRMIRRMITAKSAEKLSVTTVRHIYGMVRNVLADALREELIHRNPALAVRPPGSVAVCGAQ
jgi:hypothetical protein